MALVSERDRIQSLERGVQVLRAFGGRESWLTVVEIAARTGLARPVVRRILLTFEALGYAESTNGQWNLTPRILELGSGYFARSSLPEISYGFMGDVVERTGMTCSVGVLDAVEVIHVARVEDHRPLPDSVRIGNRLPAHATAVGKVLLAALPVEELTARLRAAPLEPQTPATIISVPELVDRVALVRQRGWDVSLEELHPGQVAAAVPIIAGDRTVGGLTASSSTVRQTEESLRESVVPVLRACAAAIGSAYRNANPQLFRAD
jgi:Transcriptional regulator